MASRPVDCMADTMADGAAVPVTVRSWSSTEGDIVCIPDQLLVLVNASWLIEPGILDKAPSRSRAHPSHVIGTANVV
jgi:hypothetical protein